jgi:hypothetical protein
MRSTHLHSSAGDSSAGLPTLPAEPGVDTRWLLVIVGDRAPEVSGPFPDDAAVLRAARAYRAREGNQDGLFRLDVHAAGCPAVSAFGGDELDIAWGTAPDFPDRSDQPPLGEPDRIDEGDEMELDA